MIRLQQRTKIILYLLLIIGAPLLIAGIWSGKLDHVNASIEAQGHIESRPLSSAEAKTIKLDAGSNRGKDANRLNSDKERQALLTMEQVAENDDLKLYLNRSTAEIAVVDKKNSYTWFSNPQERSNDTLAAPLYQAELASQLIVNYYSENGQLNRMNSYDESVAKQQIQIESIENGVQVTYTFGDASDARGIIPQTIHKEQMEAKILSKLPDEDAKKRWLSRYRLDEETGIYRVRQLQDYIAEEMAELLKSIGYTEEDALADEGEAAAEQTDVKQKPEFQVALQYKLDGDQLVAIVPSDKVSYKTSFPLASIDVLPFFGAAGTDAKGYMIVPDGSGALIHLNSEKLNAEPYVMPVYGPDDMFKAEEQWQINEKTRMPIFGMKQDDRAFIGMIEDGDGLATILADISGRNHSFNSISSRYRILAMDRYTLTSGTKSSSVPMLEKKGYEGELRIRYSFLSGDEANYVGMADVYRDYLTKIFGWKPVEGTSAPFVLELLGSFPKQKSFLGIPYTSNEALTTFDQAQTIAAMLKDAGVDDLAMRYVGWFNDGIRHESPKSVSVDRVLGGKKDWMALSIFADKENISLYADVALMEQYETSKHASYYLMQSKARKYEYDPVMNMENKSGFSYTLLSPAKLGDVTTAFVTRLKKLGTDGVSLRDLGDTLYSDFNPSQMITRQDALRTAKETALSIQQSGERVMVNGGNVYVLPAADLVVNAPTMSSRANLSDEDVPFYQIVLHGFVDLAGQPFNQGSMVDVRTSMLKAAETGMSVYYSWFYADPSAVKNTEYDSYMSQSYATWKDEAIKQYKELSELHQATRGQLITGHGKLSDGVTWTEYENNVAVIVNYTNDVVQVKGHQIEPMSFLVGTGGDLSL
ncbi:DUF5696 domain-containing protein [Paenibacillus sp. 1001270B_150601_E10]|uniref:DUF5696 domain-containing protein n=1 Tax=Paenibacillus sp. 1001270B_150601_E10 TaxID=2787079 RepID=UPI00189FA9F2|nr:DUF5696 domain-containing protein [Paenibacillus sp. 1001270B_150601_E10]